MCEGLADFDGREQNEILSVHTEEVPTGILKFEGLPGRAVTNLAVTPQRDNGYGEPRPRPRAKRLELLVELIICARDIRLPVDIQATIRVSETARDLPSSPAPRTKPM